MDMRRMVCQNPAPGESRPRHDQKVITFKVQLNNGGSISAAIDMADGNAASWQSGQLHAGQLYQRRPSNDK